MLDNLAWGFRTFARQMGRGASLVDATVETVEDEVVAVSVSVEE